MVITIAIGFYDETPSATDFNGSLADLDGVRQDIANVIDTFGKARLRYDIFPECYAKQDDDTYTAYWKEKELFKFLKQKARDLEENLETADRENKYDGLVVILSCHGLDGKCISSDYKFISKAAIHRIFSANKPKSRTIPRVFIFDCCSGNYSRESDSRYAYEQDKGMLTFHRHRYESKKLIQRK